MEWTGKPGMPYEGCKGCLFNGNCMFTDFQREEKCICTICLVKVMCRGICKEREDNLEELYKEFNQ